MSKFLEVIKEKKFLVLLVVSLIIIVSIFVAISINNKKLSYEVEKITESKYYELNVNDKIGVIDTKGNILIEAKYDEIKIPNPEKAIFICKENDKTIVLNDKNEQLFSSFSEIYAIPLKGIATNMPYEKSVLKYKENDKYGIINLEGKVITKAIYEEIESLTNKEGMLLVKESGKYGVINSRGKQIIKSEYDSIVGDGFYTNVDNYKLSGYIVCKKTENGYRYGYINCKLKKLLDTEYNELYRVNKMTMSQDIYLIASKNGQVGIIKNKKQIVDYAYQNIEYEVENNLFKVERKNKYGVMDTNGKTILPVDYDELVFKGIYINAKLADEYLIYDTLGNKIEDSKYTSVMKTDNENYFITIDKEGYYGVITDNKKILVENKYDYIEYLFDKYFIVSNEDGKLGIIDAKNNIVVNFEYDVLHKIDGTNMITANTIKDNMAVIYSKDIKKIYSGKDFEINVNKDYAKLVSKDELKYFNLDGKEISNIEVLNNKLFAAVSNKKWGFVNKEGQVIVNYIYDKVTEFNEYGFAGINKDGKWGVINEEGDVVLEPIYETDVEPEFIGKYLKVYYGYEQVYYMSIED